MYFEFGAVNTSSSRTHKAYCAGIRTFVPQISIIAGKVHFLDVGVWHLPLMHKVIIPCGSSIKHKARNEIP